MTTRTRQNRPMHKRPNRWQIRWLRRTMSARYSRNLARLNFRAMRLRGVFWLGRKWSMAHRIWLRTMEGNP